MITIFHVPNAETLHTSLRGSCGAPEAHTNTNDSLS